MTTVLDTPFEIHVIGERTGQTWAGQFKARKFLSHRQTLFRDRVFRDLLGTNPADAELKALQLATVFADTSVGLSETPDWWKTSNGGQDLVDENVVVAVWEKLQEIQADATKHLKKEGDAAKEELKKLSAEAK